jgi:hypothetical protein
MATTRENAKAIGNTVTPTPTGARLDLSIYLGYEDGHMVIRDTGNVAAIPCENGTYGAAIITMILADAERAAKKVPHEQATS